MRENAGKTKDQSKEYGLQALRSGSNTHLWREGVSAEKRRDMGGWATPSVEQGYLRRRLKEQMSFSKFFGF